MRFRKKPVEVEAMRYMLVQRDAVIRWIGDPCIHTGIGENGEEYELENIRIRTLEGEMRVDVGDWVIRGVKGEFYPCKSDIFEETYEAVS